MPIIPPLQSLGARICICGPSNSGKSTLAAAIAHHLDIEPIHLDLLYHYPNTDWVQRPREEFFAGHALAVASDSWVMDGNYMALLPQRIARATGIILLGTDRWTAFYRYLRRTLFEHGRVGSLSGAKDSLKWGMIRFIMIEQPRKRARDVAMLRATGLPMIQFNSLRELRAAYGVWKLERPAVTSLST